MTSSHALISRSANARNQRRVVEATPRRARERKGLHPPHRSQAPKQSKRCKRPGKKTSRRTFSPGTLAANSSDPHPPTSSTTNRTPNPQAFFFSLTVSMSRQSRAKAQSHHMLLYAARLITLLPAGRSSCTCNRAAQEAASSWPSCVG